MRTMNYLLVLGLLFFSSSCTDYSPFDNNGSDREPETFYLELNYYQASLFFERDELNREMLQIREEIGSGNTKRQGLLDEIQERLVRIERNIAWNEDLLLRGPIGGGGGGGPRCIPRREDENWRPCPMPRAALANLYLAAEQWQKSGGTIELLDEKGLVVGRMTGMEEVSDSDGFFLRAEIEYHSERASVVRITNLDVNEEVRTNEYRLE